MPGLAGGDLGRHAGKPMNFDERALAFPCGGAWLYGVLSLPEGGCSRGVLIVVGGPQYRAGSHRQFTLLARSLAENGIAAMRFDYRGMGDSQGPLRDFDAIGEDLRTAINAFMEAVPGMREVVLWGLCDGASAIAMYAAGDARVSGVVLLNPWVRTADGIARATLKHYYRGRLLERAFWTKLLRGRFNLADSLKSMAKLARAVLRPGRQDTQTRLPLPQRMYAGLDAFKGPVMVITSGADLTAREFCDLGAATPAWKRLLAASRVTRHQIDKADHTFSRRAWRDQVADWTCAWMRSW
jgi:exosortase A-associated hydrolase 1